jgi:sortase A
LVPGRAFGVKLELPPLRARERGWQATPLIEPPTASHEQGTPGAKWRRRGAAVLFVIGVLLVADSLATVAWQEPISALYHRGAERDLSTQLAQLNRQERRSHRRKRSGRGRRSSASAHRKSSQSLQSRIRRRAQILRRTLAAGHALGRIRIPALALDAVFVASTDSGSLRLGPGHYSSTVLPGEKGTVGIAGHRTTFSAPFRHIDELVPGDRIKVAMPYGDYVYSVERSEVTSPGDIGVLAGKRRGRLVLTACHPLFSDAKRIVVFAKPWDGPGVSPPTEERARPGSDKDIDPCLRYQCAPKRPRT